MNVLVDSSVWIDYFRAKGGRDDLDFLIDENVIVINDLVLAEIIPALHVRGQRKLIALLKELSKYPISVDWEDIIRIQITCLRNGINKIGIPDFIIAQHAIQNGLELFTNDKHFSLLAKYIPLSLYH